MAGASAHAAFSRLPRYDASLGFGDDRVSMVIAARNCGKTTLICDLLGRKTTPRVVAFLGVHDRDASLYARRLGAETHDGWDEAVANELVDARTVDAAAPPSPLTVVIDDVGMERSVLASRALRVIAMNGRCLRVGMVLATQYCAAMPPWFSGNVDRVFVGAIPIEAERHRIYDRFAADCRLDVAEFSRLLDACAAAHPRAWLVIDRTAPGGVCRLFRLGGLDSA